MDAAAELGRNPVSKHHIQPEYGDEQADAGRDCRNRLSRETKFSGTNTERGIFIFPVQLTTSRIGNLIRLIHTFAICVTIHIMRILKKNQNAPRPCEHPPVRGGKMSNRLGGIKGCKLLLIHTTFSRFSGFGTNITTVHAEFEEKSVPFLKASDRKEDGRRKDNTLNV